MVCEYHRRAKISVETSNLIRHEISLHSIQLSTSPPYLARKNALAMDRKQAELFKEVEKNLVKTVSATKVSQILVLIESDF